MKNLIFAIVALLCIQTLYGDDKTGSSNCASLRKKLAVAANKFFTKFNETQQVGRDIVNKSIRPICNSMFWTRADFRSSKYDNNLNGLQTELNKFLDSFAEAIETVLGFIRKLNKEVNTLRTMEKEFTAEWKLTCDVECGCGTGKSKCESDLNTLKCTIKSFLDEVPALAENAICLLEDLKAAVVILGDLVQKFRPNKFPTKVEIEAFLKKFGTAQDKAHGLHEMFGTICTFVDNALQESIFPAIKGE